MRLHAGLMELNPNMTPQPSTYSIALMSGAAAAPACTPLEHSGAAAIDPYTFRLLLVCILLQLLTYTPRSDLSTLPDASGSHTCSKCSVAAVAPPVAAAPHIFISTCSSHHASIIT